MYQRAFRYFSSRFHSTNFKSFNYKQWLKNSFVPIGLSLFATSHAKRYFMIQQSQSKSLREHIKQAYEAQQQMKKIVELQICQSEDIKQSQIYPVEVKNKDGSLYTILIIRYNGKLYAVGGQCTHKSNLLAEGGREEQSLAKSICFGDKLMCPYHGCAFDLKSGTVQYGPATLNLPIFAVSERKDQVFLSFPEKIPKAVNPRTVPRDHGDQRKVLILGEDHNASIGCIDGLRQFGFDGQISVVLQNNQYPYHKDMLHKSIINLKLKQKYKKIPKNIDAQIEKLIEEKIYSKLLFHPQKWYQQHGIEFVYNSQSYRIIHKRFYPYVTFFDGTKKEYDGLVIATDVIPVKEKLNGITANKDDQLLYPQNVFAPFRNKAQHLKLMKFLNKNEVKNMIVFGVDQFALEFIQNMKTEFPNIKIQVLDTNRQNKLFQIYGEELTYKILKQYTSRNTQFYMRIDSVDITSSNKLSKELNQADMQLKTPQIIDPKDLKNSIQIKFGEGNNEVKLNADCLVYFPSKYEGNTLNIKKKSKYTDIDYSQENRIVTEPTQRTDSSRIFSIGTVAENEFFFTKSRLNTFNPNVLYQQGFNCALNLVALGIPFTYLPVEITEHFGKKLYHCGTQNYINQMIVMGSIQKWDFLILYAKNEKIYSAVASESRQKQFQVIRQAFRLQCQPQFSSIVNNQWDIPKVYKLIKKLDKSHCYRDQIHKVQDDPIKSNIIWVERRKGAGFSNDRPSSQDQSGLQVDQRGYVRQV